MTATNPRPTCPSEVRVEDHIGLVWQVMRRYRYDHPGVRGTLALEDLVQVGVEGLMKARDCWRPELGGWSTIASLWVRHMIGRCIQDHSATVRVPVHLQAARGRSGERMRADVCSLDRPIGGGDSGGATHLDMLAAREPHDRSDLPDVDLEGLIAGAPDLTPKQAYVLRERAKDRTLKDIGHDLGCSRGRVRGWHGIQVDDDVQERIERHEARKQRSAMYAKRTAA